MGKLGSAFYILGAIFWVISIPATGLIGVVFAAICIILAVI